MSDTVSEACDCGAREGSPHSAWEGNPHGHAVSCPSYGEGRAGARRGRGGQAAVVAGIVAATVADLVDEMAHEINPGILGTVRLLRASGFDTCDSGDGRTGDYECDRDEPYVSILTAPVRMADEADRLADMLRSRGVRVEPIGAEVEGPCAHIQASYDPANGVAILDLSGVDDEALGLGAS